MGKLNKEISGIIQGLTHLNSEMEIPCSIEKEITVVLSYVQSDATLLDVTCCVRLHTLLHAVGIVVAQSLKTGQTFSYVHCDGRNNVGSCCLTMLRPFAWGFSLQEESTLKLLKVCNNIRSSFQHNLSRKG